MTAQATEAQLQSILERGDVEECLEFFQGMAEKRRRTFAPACLKWLREIGRNETIETSLGPRTPPELIHAARAALFSTATLSELVRLPNHSTPDDPTVYRILVDRRPSWTADWAHRMLDSEVYWWHWKLVRDLVRAGRIPQPQHPNYFLGMISGMAESRHQRDENATMDQYLLSDPGLLEDEFWRLFEFDGNGVNSLANWDRWNSQISWLDAILRLMNQGRLSRDRLLDCSLDALERDFNHYRARWFAQLHDALEPTEAEREQFAPRYMRLLGASAPNIVTWSLAQVEGLAKKKVYASADLLSGLVPALQARTKGNVKKSLKLLATIAKDAPDQRSAICLTATTALVHEAADVQQAVLDLIEKFGSHQDDELLVRLREYSDYLAPSSRLRLESWQPSQVETTSHDSTAAPLLAGLEQLDADWQRKLGIDALQAALREERLEIPAATHHGADIPRLGAVESLQPITNVDDLIDVCARVVEDDSLVDEAERALDGISRWCAAKPDDFAVRTGPLLKRVTTRLEKHCAPFGGLGPLDDLCGVIYAWITGQALQGKRKGSTYQFTFAGTDHNFVATFCQSVGGFLSRRALAIAKRVAVGEARPLLSAPTHAGGWIAADELVTRVLAWDPSHGEPDPTDVCLALLRLAPDDRAEAIRRLSKGPSAANGEWVEAIRYSLGADDVSMGTTAPYWIAAARARDPWSSDSRVMEQFPGLGPDAGEAATYEFYVRKQRYHVDVFTLQVVSQPPVPEKIDPLWVTVTLHDHLQPPSNKNRHRLREIASRSVGAKRWTATVWPLARESYFAVSALELADNIDWWEARWENKSLLEPLLDPGTPLKPMACLLLGMGLAAKEPGESGLATDVCIRAISEGRLVPDNLGDTLREILPSGLIKAGRWAKTLSAVAQTSPLHATVVQQSIQRALQGDPAPMPRDFAQLLDLLRELSLDLGQSIVDTGCRDFLAKVKPTGKAGKAARALLALPPSDFATVGRPVLLEALTRRIESARQLMGNR
jgi:hypothetical protein